MQSEGTVVLKDSTERTMMLDCTERQLVRTYLKGTRCDTSTYEGVWPAYGQANTLFGEVLL